MRKGSFVVTAKAKADLEMIARYLLEHAGESVAHAVLNEMHRDIALLALFPQLAPRRPHPLANARIWPRYPYLIVYADRGQTIRILRVLHGARDLPRLLDEDNPTNE